MTCNAVVTGTQFLLAETLVTVHVISFSIPDAQNICPYFVSHMLVAHLMSSMQVKHGLASAPSSWETDENSWAPNLDYTWSVRKVSDL